MTIDFRQLNKHSESETLELKESFDSKALETIGAFANAGGGTILVGVSDDGNVRGITLGHNSLEEWAQRMPSKIQPRFLPSVIKQEFEGKTVVSIIVLQSDSLLCVDGRYFKRVGRTNQIMSPEETKQRLLIAGNTSWDKGIEQNATLSDLDEHAVDQFIGSLNASGRRPVPIGEDPYLALEKMGLLRDKKPTKAAILLLGNEPGRFYASAFVKAGRFKSPTKIVDDKEFSGTLFQQIDKAISWFSEKLEVKYIFGKNGGSKQGNLAEREEEWQYPFAAIREGVVNAICHRDYQSLAATNLRLYDGRLEIWNPGTLPPGLKADDLLQDHSSHAPNRLIAEALYNTGLIERWGSGTQRIAQALDEQDLPPPLFDVSLANNFKLTMFASGPSANKLRHANLNERQIKAIQKLYTSINTINSSEYQMLFGASKATATRDLSDLVSKGILAKEGKGVSTFYHFADQAKDYGK